MNIGIGATIIRMVKSDTKTDTSGHCSRLPIPVLLVGARCRGGGFYKVQIRIDGTTISKECGGAEARNVVPSRLEGIPSNMCVFAQPVDYEPSKVMSLVN